MQGYILRVQKVRDEDCLVFILTPQNLLKTYRFYGARHPVITQGFKIDFELEMSANFLPHLRGVMHLGFKWLHSRSHLAIWQNFMRLLFEHLKGIEGLDGFYFSLLERCCERFGRQNPKRVAVEAYLEILDFEGRLYRDDFCFICGEKLGEKIVLVRAFLLSCERCLGRNLFDYEMIKTMLKSKKTAHIDDEILEQIYYIFLEGL